MSPQQSHEADPQRRRRPWEAAFQDAHAKHGRRPRDRHIRRLRVRRFHPGRPWRGRPCPSRSGCSRGAEWVAGSVGSGLYGSMFPPKDCRRIILAPSHFFTPNDLMLSRTHGPTYLLDERGPKDPKKAIVEDWEDRRVQRQTLPQRSLQEGGQGEEAQRRAASAPRRDVSFRREPINRSPESPARSLPYRAPPFQASCRACSRCGRPRCREWH